VTDIPLPKVVEESHATFVRIFHTKQEI